MEEVPLNLSRLSCLRVLLWAGLLAVGGVVGCGHHRRERASEPPPPPIQSTHRPTPRSAPKSAQRFTPKTPSKTPGKPSPSVPLGLDQGDLDFVTSHQPIYTQEGVATWYTAPKGRQSANGQIFDDNGMTAAHRTLPMGSLVMVTNLKTGQSAVLRITDRGPFIVGRIIDLSKAAAQATGIYREGATRVRMDVYQTPKPVRTGGRWCVQIGAFKSEDEALRLKSELIQLYPDARVIEFPGMESSYWVRIRPVDDNRAQAKAIAAQLHPTEGAAFLTRLD